MMEELKYIPAKDEQTLNLASELWSLLEENDKMTNKNLCGGLLAINDIFDPKYHSIENKTLSQIQGRKFGAKVVNGNLTLSSQNETKKLYQYFQKLLSNRMVKAKVETRPSFEPKINKKSE